MQAKTQEYKKIKSKNKTAKIIFCLSIIVLFISIISAIAYKNATSIFIALTLISLIALIISKKIKNKTNYIIEQIEINRIAKNEADK